MKKIIIALMFVFISSSVYGYDYKNFYTINDWSTQDIVLESTLVGMAIIDYCYSLDLIYNPYIYKNGKKYRRYEGNPLIGNPVTQSKMIIFGVISLSIHSYIANIILHGKWRTLWQSSFIIIEGANLYKIKRMGLQFHCPLK